MKPLRVWHRLMTAFISALVGFTPTGPAFAQSKAKSKKPYTITEQDVEQTGYETREVMIGGEKFRVVEVKNAFGRVLRQMVIGADRHEVSFDRNADGYLDGWMLVTKDTTIEMKEPYNGGFLLMDVDQRLEKETVQLQFSLNIRTGKYSLFASKRIPHRLLHNDVFIVGCKGGEGNRIHEDAEALQKFILGGTENLNSLKADLEKNLIDKSCKEEPFKESLPYILNGIMSVAASDKHKFDPAGGPPKEKGKFLQCLRHYEMDYHAAKIAAAIEEFNGSKPLRPSWQFVCVKNSDTSGVQATYSRSASPPKVTFHKPITKISDKHSAGVGDEVAFANKYAQNFFHEMVHHSGILDEDLTDAVVGCCSSEKYEGSPVCNDLAKRVRAQKYAQMFRGGVATKVDYSEYRDSARDIFGPAADEMMDEFEQRVGALYDEYANREDCSLPNSTEIYGKCKTQFMEEFRDILNKSFQIEGCFTTVRNAYLDRKAYIGINDPKAKEKTALREQLAEAAKEYAQKTCQVRGALANKIFLSEPGEYNRICSEIVGGQKALHLSPSNLFLWALSVPKAMAEAELTDVWRDTPGLRDCSMEVDSNDTEIHTRLVNTAPLPSSTPPRGTPDPYGNSFNVPHLPGAGAYGNDVKVPIEKGDIVDRYVIPKPEEFNPPKTVDDRNRMGPSIEEGKKAAVEVGNEGISGTDRPGGGQVRIPASTQGPKIVLGDEGPSSSGNEKEVLDHIDRSNGVIGDTKRIAEKISRGVIPRAEAAERNQSSRPVANLGAGGKGVSLLNMASNSVPVNPPKANVVSIFVDPSGLGKGSSFSLKTGSASQAKSDPSSLGLAGQSGGAGKGQNLSFPSGSGRAPSSGSPAAASLGGPGGMGSGMASNASASKPSLSGTPDPKRTEKELDSAIKSLMGPYDDVKKLLVRPDFISRLIRHQIQVTDDQGKIHGSRAPKHRLIYSRETQRLEYLQTPES